MSLRWVCETVNGEHGVDLRLGVHLAFQWKDFPAIRTACHRDLGKGEWIDAEMIVAPVRPPRPPLVDCPKCAALTVAEVARLHGKWMRNENP